MRTNWNPYTLLVRMQKGAAALGKYLAIPQRIKELPDDLASFLGER